jgi:hypothetical protein
MGDEERVGKRITYVLLQDEWQKCDNMVHIRNVET